MCNLYSITTNQAAIIALFRAVNRYVGNLAPMPGVLPLLGSTRTRQALAAAKARGASLGSPTLHLARRNAAEAVSAEANRFAANVLPIIREAQKAGATTLREIAAALNARGVATARGGQWHAKSVSNVLERG